MRVRGGREARIEVEQSEGGETKWNFHHFKVVLILDMLTECKIKC